GDLAPSTQQGRVQGETVLEQQLADQSKFVAAENFENFFLTHPAWKDGALSFVPNVSNAGDSEEHAAGAAAASTTQRAASTTAHHDTPTPVAPPHIVVPNRRRLLAELYVAARTWLSQYGVLFLFEHRKPKRVTSSRRSRANIAAQTRATTSGLMVARTASPESFELLLLIHGFYEKYLAPAGTSSCSTSAAAGATPQPGMRVEGGGGLLEGDYTTRAGREEVVQKMLLFLRDRHRPKTVPQPPTATHAPSWWSSESILQSAATSALLQLFFAFVLEPLLFASTTREKTALLHSITVSGVIHGAMQTPRGEVLPLGAGGETGGSKVVKQLARTFLPRVSRWETGLLLQKLWPRAAAEMTKVRESVLEEFSGRYDTELKLRRRTAASAAGAAGEEVPYSPGRAAPTAPPAGTT
ncbi:unnamed protein product, partial [Amoebophrya sp. A120]